MIKNFFVGIVIVSVFLPLSFIPVTYGEQIIERQYSYAEFLNLAEISGEKYQLQVDEQTIEMIYGFGGSFDDFGKESEPAILSGMQIDQENKSLIITFSDVPETQTFWINLPVDVISADKGKYQLFIDNIEKGYELTKFYDVYSIGFPLPVGSKNIEIVGTHVIPEFGQMTIIVLGVSLLSIAYFARKSNIVRFKI